MIHVLYTKAARKDQVITQGNHKLRKLIKQQELILLISATKTRTTSTIESASHNTNIKLKFLNFKTSITITPTALKTLTMNAIDA
ncbi:hypothetical protein MKX08_003197 [Trichoderma sp. CBMAI-0020]|nr:hypothetical protein MKX08_003197 [Trichoderma sp. CBMAI-0020]